MKWREIAITTRQENADAMAEIFEAVGAMGMVIEDPQLIASYIESNVWDLHDVEIPDVPEGMIRVKTYLAIDNTLEERLAALQEELSARERSEKWPAHAWTMTDLHEDDWAHAWKAFFKPEKVGRRVVIRPTWEEYVPKEDDLVISIDPGMAFGTGTHPTTVMCIRALEDYVHAEAHVLDVGTGSGVLSIAAALLGAKRVLAVDNDPVAVATAQENVILNQVDEIVEVRRNDLLSGLSEQADILVANIIADVIIRLAPQAAALLAPEGIMIASGIIQNRLDDVVAAMTEKGFSIEELISHGEWAAIVARRAGVSAEG
ncbi:ribosomal protein l11 methyltransferase [Heliomicrobium modesticaldum Ice1]|uniref:Ribosomal protein L11 methyltransferase n=1 Tax=Heliobacterium modesticaldum (strain ATCC 51547 / Ice1) TaxID=498761 RepID=PRMA_HELMI|nr:50S ribosomal protein L11 methyltransferase [Heliomicrobium modesticaldum]B0TAD9.1 RecName: Full=Ribosomal protein L11 methyltransferase; Short=L11 Mtase [Heliomicrobium modesticaldum Ice1]ABZ84989.1 ribosomal protein l11 methyltransferase [Heliomicrobium modesticaldum Ice1]